MVILDHGLDADFTALGFRVPASRVLDSAIFLGLRALALDVCHRTGPAPPRTVSLENPGPVGLVPLVEALTGIKLRSPSTPHDPVADCLATLALFRAVAPQFVAAWERDRPLVAERNVGVGFPLDSMRAAYLPADLLLAAPPLLVDRRNQPHPELAPPVPPRVPGNQYLRQPLEWNTLTPAPESLQNACNIFSAVQALTCSIADIDPILWDGFAPHFARFRDVHGESLEGAGSMSATDPEAHQLPDGNRVVPAVDDLHDYGVPCSFQPDEDRSGAFLVRQSAGADRLRGGEALATTGSFDVALPVPNEAWQAIWTPVV